MQKMNYLLLIAIIGLVWNCESKRPVVAVVDQPEFMAWGNLNGIRLSGELMAFKSSLRVVREDWDGYEETAKERNRQRHRYDREGATQTVTGILAPLAFRETVTESTPGSAKIDIEFTAEADTTLEGVFFCIALPMSDYGNGSAQPIDSVSTSKQKYNFSTISEDTTTEVWRKTAKGMQFSSENRQLKVVADRTGEIIIRKENDHEIQVYFTLHHGAVEKDQIISGQFSLTADGTIDREPIHITMDADKPGQVFDGFGGNFRLQNADNDPQVIQYCLDNLRIAWGRVEMPWMFWHPDVEKDPVAEAEAGNLHPRVDAAMHMARRLGKRGIPVIVSDWSAPAWAIIGDPRNAWRPQPGGLRGYPLNPGKMPQIYQSIGAYLLYLKNKYGVEAYAFSFNESDLGINVRQTAEEHRDFIKGLGQYLASLGLATKLLLGDTSDANPIDFIKPTMTDPVTIQYVAAVSFHSWRGCTKENLEFWSNAARTLNVPLLIGEGSTDAAAWRYSKIFDEPSFAMYEINLYTRICAIAQPKSILQWQLTSDYSILAGGGIFDNEAEELRPTQRFWNLKQLADTPEGAFALPIESSSESVNCAAFGNLANEKYAIHIVNYAAGRETTIFSIPESVREFRVFVTDNARGMEASDRVKVINGTVTLLLEPVSFTSLYSGE